MPIHGRLSTLSGRSRAAGIGGALKLVAWVALIGGEAAPGCHWTQGTSASSRAKSGEEAV